MRKFKWIGFLGLIWVCMVAKANMTTCTAHCISPFGNVIGKSLRTTAYSNCHDQCKSELDNRITVSGIDTPIYTGMKWQCVEYARRWLIENTGFTFKDVDFAYLIWQLDTATDIHTQKHQPWQHFRNYRSVTPPKVGDLLIYSQKLAVTGHVAVIVGVDQNSITIAEQNYFNRMWEGKDYARRLMLEKDKQDRYGVVDVGVIGWMRIK